jgi:hypothetical protein
MEEGGVSGRTASTSRGSIIGQSAPEQQVGRVNTPGHRREPAAMGMSGHPSRSGYGFWQRRVCLDAAAAFWISAAYRPMLPYARCLSGLQPATSRRHSKLIQSHSAQ